MERRAKEKKTAFMTAAITFIGHFTEKKKSFITYFRSAGISNNEPKRDR